MIGGEFSKSDGKQTVHHDPLFSSDQLQDAQISMVGYMHFSVISYFKIISWNEFQDELARKLVNQGFTRSMMVIGITTIALTQRLESQLIANLNVFPIVFSFKNHVSQLL